MTLQWVPEWLALLPVVAAMLVVWVGTSFFWLRVARIPTSVAIAVSPAVTGAVVWLASLVYYRLGWFWSGARVLPVLVAFGALGAVAYVLVTRKWGPVPSRQTFGFREVTSALPRPKVWIFALAVLAGWILAILPTILVSAPDNPVQQWDPSFHMNGVWGITQLGIGAPGEGLAHNYGGSPSSEYPIGWHAFTALFATGPTAVMASNASSLAIMALWVAGVGIYAHTLYPGRTIAFAAPVIAGIMPSMPADALTMYSQWPNALSVAYLPGIATLAVIVGRVVLCKAMDGTICPGWPTVLSSTGVLLVALWGAIQAHPVIAFNLLVLLLPAVIGGGWALLRYGLWRRRPLLFLGVPLIAVLGVGVLTFVMLTPEVTSMRNYVRHGVGLSTAFSQIATPLPPFPSAVGLTVAASILSTLAVVGTLWIVLARFSFRSGYKRLRWARWTALRNPVVWPVWSYVLFLVLVFFAYGPDWSIRKWIVGPWFSDGRRIMEPMSVALVTLAAVGFEWLVIWIVRWWNHSMAPGTSKQRGLAALGLGSILLVGSVVGGMDGRVNGARYVMDADNLGKPGMATQGVLDMMRTLPEILDEDAVVLGDPQAGAMYSQMLGQRWAYFPQLSFSNNAEQQDVLIQRFKDINTDPEVCEVIRETGITHYFANADGAYYGRMRSDRAPGLYNVDTSNGFELVAEGDEGRLYKITACD